MIKNKLLHTLLALLLLVVALLPNGVSATALCRKEGNDKYKCGGGDVKLNTVVDQPIANMWTETCAMNNCCCHDEDAWDSLAVYQRSTCDDQQGTAIGCYACAGEGVCRDLVNSKIGDYGCVGKNACYGANNLVVGSNSCRDGDYVCFKAINSSIGNDSCVGERACEYADDNTIGNDSCLGKNACYMGYDFWYGNVIIGDNSCVKTGSSDAFGVCETTKDMVIGKESCRGDRGTCHYSVNSKIGDRSCQTKVGGDGEVENCYSLKSAEIGNDSCKDQFSCKYIGPRYAVWSISWKVGNGSCQDNISCYNAGRGDLYDAQVEPQGVDIGDDSCNADQVCRDCEAGSVVPAGTCNDLGNVDQVGTLSQEGDYGGTTGTRKGDKRCRACFAELHPEDYSVSVAVSTPTPGRRRRRRRRRALAADPEDGSCSDHAQDVKARVMTFLRNHDRFVGFLKETDMPKKCVKKYLTAAVGHRSNIFDKGCDLAFKFVLKLDKPFLKMLKDTIAEALPEEVVLKDVLVTKMNCKKGRGKSDKRSKGDKAGKPGKK